MPIFHCIHPNAKIVVSTQQVLILKGLHTRSPNIIGFYSSAIKKQAQMPVSTLLPLWRRETDDKQNHEGRCFECAMATALGKGGLESVCAGRQREGFARGRKYESSLKKHALVKKDPGLKTMSSVSAHLH